MNRGMRELIAEELAIDIAEKYPVLDSCDKCGELLNNSFKQIPTSEGIKIVCEKCYGYRVMPEKGLEMREKPIIFNTEMVNAILDGRKTMTRRVIKLDLSNADMDINDKNYLKIMDKQMDYRDAKDFCRYQPGDILWVRETWSTEDEYYIYKADLDDWNHLDNLKWRPSIHMPRAAARIFLKVKEVSVERVQDITEEDVMREGWPFKKICEGDYDLDYFALWNKLNKKRGYGWDTNPWVFVIEFKVKEALK